MYMVMTWIYLGILCCSVFAALWTGNGPALAAAIPQGAQAGITLAVSLSGSMCLWSGAGRLMEHTGITGMLAKLLSPVMIRIFPSAGNDRLLAGSLSANICANILGLGNAATPMGVQAALRMVRDPGVATDEMCRLIVLNSASIQLIPANVAALRTSLGCDTPFDILPAVWITSLCSAGLGLIAAWALGKVWRND
jgi:spore maturation protein A